MTQVGTRVPSTQSQTFPKTFINPEQQKVVSPQELGTNLGGVQKALGKLECIGWPEDLRTGLVHPGRP